MPNKNIWNISFYIVTWNVAQRHPDNTLLNSLLGIDGISDLPDFFIVGLQEISAQPQNVMASLFKEDPWVLKIKELLQPLDYVIVKTEQMQGLLLTVFTKRKHLLHLREIETDYTRTGFGGMWGNKGAVSIRLNVYGSSVCLINSHLAAHDHMLEERINDYHKIIEHQKFSVKTSGDIFSHDFIFWLGDLNFRLTGDATTTPEDIREMVRNDELPELLSRDQLLMVMANKQAFQGFTERPPQFPPTFKFEPGTPDYDMKRRPAWCDRILYKTRPKQIKNVTLELEQTSYKSHPTYMLSDHRPVSSEFMIKVKEVLHVFKEKTARPPIIKPSLPLPATRPLRPTRPRPIYSGLSGLNQIPVAVMAMAYKMPLTSPDLDLTFDQIDDTDADDNNELFYDTYDTTPSQSDFEMTDSSDDDDQVPDDDISEKTIEFLPFEIWNNSEDNHVEYILPRNFEDGGADWIGVYREDFNSLDDYLSYEYTETGGKSAKPEKQTIKINFPASINLPLIGKFRLLYFQSTGTKGCCSLIGISDPFSVIKRCPSPRFDNID